jgi:hypothetical protein
MRVCRPEAAYPDAMDLAFTGEIWFWKGPAPWYFVTVPEAESDVLDAMSSQVSYGWGVIPVTARIGETSWPTSLFPKDGQYLVPVKAQVRRAERLELGDEVAIRLIVGPEATASAEAALPGEDR